MKFTNKVLGLSLVAFVGFASSSFADDSKVAGSKKSLETRIAELEAKLKDAGVGGGVKGSGIKISGYVDTSYIVNLSDRSNTGPAPGSSIQNDGRVFDNQYDSFNINAVKLTIEKGKDSGKYPAGFRVDTIYGEDANVLNGTAAATTVGNDDSELFLEQAYINLGVPIGNGIDVKLGKMVSIMGYEVIESPANWQFSRSDAFRLVPGTQAGVTLGYQWADWITSTVGLINGIDNATAGTAAAAGDNATGAGNFNTSLSFVGRLDLTAPKTSFGDFNGFIAGLYGNDDTTATASNDRAISIINFGVTWNRPFEVKALAVGAEYLFRHDDVAVGSTSGITTGLNSPATREASTVSAYGKWDWNNRLTSSLRYSYSGYNNPDSVPVGTASSLGALVVPGTITAAAGGSTGSGGFQPRYTDMHSITLTQAFNVWKDTLLRLEWRRDWTDTPAVGFGTPNATGTAGRDDIRQEQDTIAVNVVYSF